MEKFVPMTMANPQYYEEIVTKLKNIEVIDLILTERKNSTDWTYM